MTRQVQDSHETAIARVQGGPNEPDRPGERSRWRRFKEFIFPWLKKGSRLGDEYASAKVAQERNKAAKIAEEAAEIAAKVEVQKQRAVAEFGANVGAIFAADGLSAAAKVLKLAKLVEMNPQLAEQFEKVKALLDTLHLTKGVSIQPLEEELEGARKGLPDDAAGRV